MTLYVRKELHIGVLSCLGGWASKVRSYCWIMVMLQFLLAYSLSSCILCIHFCTFNIKTPTLLLGFSSLCSCMISILHEKLQEGKSDFVTPSCLMFCIFSNLEIILKAAIWSGISSIYNSY